MISVMLVYVPLTRPTTAISVIIVFLVIISAFSDPLVVFQYTQVSIIAGNANPRAERHSAPNNAMNNSRLGIATASKTAKRNVSS